MFAHRRIRQAIGQGSETEGRTGGGWKRIAGGVWLGFFGLVVDDHVSAVGRGWSPLPMPGVTFNSWNVATIDENAVTLLHELGHILRRFGMEGWEFQHQ